jgi:hypothetical protein
MTAYGLTTGCIRPGHPELAEQVVEADVGPVPDALAGRVHLNEVELLNADRPSGGLVAEERAVVGAGDDDPHRYPVSFGDDVGKLGVLVGKSAPELGDGGLQMVAEVLLVVLVTVHRVSGGRLVDHLQSAAVPAFVPDSPGEQLRPCGPNRRS